MRKVLFKIFFGLTFLSISFSSFSQGCSDAGFCTISSFKPEDGDSTKEVYNQFKIGMNYGSADKDITVVGNYFEYNRKFTEKLSADIKLTTLMQSGNDITAFGVSDIYLNGNYKATENTGVTVGFKIPLTNGNTMKDGLPLPMDYQASLGTFDLLLGVVQKIEKFKIILALQQPLTQNSNAFVASQYPMGSPLRNFQTTNNYKRSGDALLRFSYPFKLGEKFKITPSVLSIYHLGEDQYTNASDVETNIVGSEGLTLNLNAYLDYKINEKSALELSYGSPVITRDARPDGLTRGFVVNLQYAYKF